MKKPIWAGLLMWALGWPLAVLAQPALTPQQIAQQAKRTTVQIRTLDAAGRVTGAGSGFFISRDGLLVSNLHVVEDAVSLEIERDSGEIFDNVYYVTSDVRRDTVILKVPVSNVEALPLGSDETAEIGSRIYVMGNPLGQTATFSDGLVSAKRMVEGVELVQITAPISPGSSGGPAMNERGEVIGIATMFLEGGQNLNFLVPIHHVPPLVAMGERPQRFAASLLPGAERAPAPVTAASGTSGQAAAASALTADAEQVARSLTSQMQKVEDYLRPKGFTLSHDPGVEALKAKENEDTSLQLDAGRTYAVVAVCDDDCSDVDMALLDTQGKSVVRDVDGSDVAMLSYVPTVSGRHWIRVRVAACSAEPCGYAVQVFVRQ
ncbi:MAG: trypsin-like peptidase domain-containing protein [Gammaproteobacteria bacterium]|nr:trypsin-like peptidase domain-containing protein [Gammaproteobacteria bacterium]